MRSECSMVKTWTATVLLSAGVAANTVASAQESREKELVFDFKPRIQLPWLDDTNSVKTQPVVQDLRMEIYRQPRGSPRCSIEQRESLDGPQVGVALSGGVSKGLAFIGALAYLDEVGIRIDGIVGTSMGAVVASFYASGYSPRTIYQPRKDAESARIPAGKISEIVAYFERLKPRIGGSRQRIGGGRVSRIDVEKLFSDLPPTCAPTTKKQHAPGARELK